MARFAVVKDDIITGAFEADGVDQIGVYDGEVAMAWDDAMAQYELSDALRPQPPGSDPVPQQVGLFQARVIMATTPHEGGDGTLLGAAEAAIDGLPDALDRQIARQGLQHANVLSRNGRIVGILADALGLDDAALDDLFRAAAAVNV